MKSPEQEIGYKRQLKLEELKADNLWLRVRTVDLRLDLGKANADNQRLRELLRKMPEWVYDKDQECYFCEVCGSNKDYGHLKNCELAKELSDVRR